MKPKKHLPNVLKRKQLIQRISEEYGVSENAVRLVLRGLTEIVTKEVAQGNPVQLFGLGYFWLNERKNVTTPWLQRINKTYRRQSVKYPHFQVSVQFRNNVQALNGEPPSDYNGAKSMEEAMMFAEKQQKARLSK